MSADHSNEISPQLILNQGQGETTRRKEQGFAALLRMSLRISKAVGCVGFPYWHIDLNSGSGFNELIGCPGSPVVFWEEARLAARPVIVYFCDHDQEAIESLSRKLIGPASFLNCDNAECLAQVTTDIRQKERRPEFAIGTVLCDPNGWTGFPLDALAEFSEEFQRIDIILNLNATMLKLFKGCKGSNHPNVRRHHNKPDLEEIVGKLSKRHWFIRNPGKSAGMRFVTLVGRNMPTKRTSFLDFVALDSPAGREIMETLRRVNVGQRVLFSDI